MRILPFLGPKIIVFLSINRIDGYIVAINTHGTCLHHRVFRYYKRGSKGGVITTLKGNIQSFGHILLSPRVSKLWAGSLQACSLLKVQGFLLQYWADKCLFPVDGNFQSIIDLLIIFLIKLARSITNE